MTVRVGIIDYGMGNLLSVYHAFEIIGADVILCAYPEDIRAVDRLVLPGVGAFKDCMRNLEDTGFKEALNYAVFQEGRPIMGICLGMEVMARKSYEGGEYEGLGWFEAEVLRLQPRDPSLRVPHVGWNDITYREGSHMFKGVPHSTDFYFVHSFYMSCDREEDVEATCDYGGLFTASVKKDNIFATQFHPEKSQDYGLKVLENFLNWKP